MSEKKLTVREQIQNLLAPFKIKLAEEAPVKVELKTSGKLADGTEIGTPADAFTVDAEVFVMDPDGNQMPAPDGEHMIDGKIKITVVGGKITAAEPVAEEEMQLSAEIQSVITDLATRLSDLETKYNASTTELTAVKGELVTTKTKLSAAETKVTELSKKAGATSVTKTGGAGEPKKVEFKKHWNDMTVQERIKYPELNPKLSN